MAARRSRPITRLCWAFMCFAGFVATTVSPMQASAASRVSVSIEPDFANPTGVEHVVATNTIVVSGDDAVEIRSMAGERIERVSGIPGAVFPTENQSDSAVHDRLIVVYASATQEFVVLDAGSGQVTHRFASGAPSVSSVEFIGDSIWFAHGPDALSPAGIGKASIDDATVELGVWADGVADGARVLVSPGDPSQVFTTHVNVGNISFVQRFDEGSRAPKRMLTPLGNPVVSNSGTTIWAQRSSQLLELDSSTLTFTGRSVEIGHYPTFNSQIVGDTQVTVLNSGMIRTFLLDDDTQVGIARYEGFVTDFDATTDQIVALVDLDIFADSDAPPRGTRLVISALDHGQIPVGPDNVPIGDHTGACPAVTESIDRLYSAYFLRDAEPDGWHYWRDEYSSGRHNLDSMSDFFAASPEFQASYGALTDTEFVSLVYRNVLGRDPDSAGRQYWIDQLSTGAIDRGRLMIGFSESEEYVRITDTSIPLAGYFNWYPPGTRFWCGRTDTVDLTEGDKFVDILFTNPSSTRFRYRIESQFDGEWYLDVSEEVHPSTYSLFIGVPVNMSALQITGGVVTDWVVVESPSPLPTQRAGWPLLSVQSGLTSNEVFAFDSGAQEDLSAQIVND